MKQQTTIHNPPARAPASRRARGWWAGWLLALALPAGATQVTFDVQPRLLNLGESAQATLTFHGVRSAPNVDFPPIPGLQITGTGQQMQFGSGGSRVSLTYNLFAQKAGAHTIGPYHLEFNGEQIDIPAVTIEVRGRADGDNAAPQDMIFARLNLPATAPFIHQMFDVVLAIYSLPGVELTRDVSLLGGLPESGFVLSNFDELPMTREEVAGQIYTLRRFRARARALTSGTFHLQPALRVGVINPPDRRRQDPFGGFFDPFGGATATPVAVTPPPADLVVRALPTAARPADFSGAVGQYNFTVDVRPRELHVGQPITVTLRVEGAGNIAATLPPSYQETDSFKAYEARQVGDTPAPAAENGSKTFEQVVIPRTETLTELPALRFSYFDPVAAEYRAQSAGPFPLTVQPSETGANALLLQVPGTANGSGNTLVLGTDIIYLKPAPARWRRTDARGISRPAWLGLHAAAPLALAGLYFATRRRNRLATDIALARRQKAPRSARAKLRQAEAALRTSGAPAAVFGALAAAAADYFGHRLNLPPGAVDAPLMLAKLAAAGAAVNDQAQWREFFNQSDHVRYASAATMSRAELSEWIAAVSGLLRRAERLRL